MSGVWREDDTWYDTVSGGEGWVFGCALRVTVLCLWKVLAMKLKRKACLNCDGEMVLREREYL